MQGHTDLAFAVEFLNDTHLISGSRDGSVCLWNTDSLSGDCDRTLVSDLRSASTLVGTKHQHSNKVRDLTVGHGGRQFASVSVDGELKIWDSWTFMPVSTFSNCVHGEHPIPLQHDDERGIYVLGVNAGIWVVDSRMPGHACLGFVAGLNPDGIRSVDVRNDVVVSGTECGMLNFYDLRGANYLAQRPITSQNTVS